MGVGRCLTQTCGFASNFGNNSGEDLERSRPIGQLPYNWFALGCPHSVLFLESFDLMAGFRDQNLHSIFRLRMLGADFRVCSKMNSIDCRISNERILASGMQ